MADREQNHVPNSLKKKPTPESRLTKKFRHISEGRCQNLRDNLLWRSVTCANGAYDTQICASFPRRCAFSP